MKGNRTESPCRGKNLTLEEGHFIHCKRREGGKDGFWHPSDEWREERTGFYNLISKDINVYITLFHFWKLRKEGENMSLKWMDHYLSEGFNESLGIRRKIWGWPCELRAQAHSCVCGGEIGRRRDPRMGESLIPTVTGERVVQKIVRQLPSISAQAKLPVLILLTMAA